MNFDEFVKFISDYVDREFEKDFFEEFDRLDEMMEKEFAEMEKFAEGMEKEFFEMDKLIEEDPDCRALFKTMKKTVELCRGMSEIEVPDDIHRKLFRKIEEIEI